MMDRDAVPALFARAEQLSSRLPAIADSVQGESMYDLVRGSAYVARALSGVPLSLASDAWERIPHAERGDLAHTYTNLGQIALALCAEADIDTQPYAQDAADELLNLAAYAACAERIFDISGYPRELHKVTMTPDRAVGLTCAAVRALLAWNGQRQYFDAANGRFGARAYSEATQGLKMIGQVCDGAAGVVDADQVGLVLRGGSSS